MIINQPTKEDFENIAKQCLTQAFNIVYEIDKDLKYFEDVDDRDVWYYNLRNLSTSLILIHQAIESFLKSSICEKTPLLLIELKRTDWPSMPNSVDKDFNELFTIGGDSLIRTYCSVVDSTKVNSNLTDFIEEIRIARNKIIHGVARDNIDPPYLLRSILKTYNFFLGVDSWWLTIRDHYLNNPIFGKFNNDFEEASLIDKLDYAEKKITTAELKNYFSLDLDSRRYYCPWCMDSLEEEDQELETKWALLIPQKRTGATKIKCINCQRDNIVIREDCPETDCRGNVLFQGDDRIICLTCNSEKDDI